jgi:hypothetical protein
MIRFSRILPILALAVGVGLLGAPTTADAAMKLRIDTSVTAGVEQEITDDGAGDLANTTAGVISYSTVSGSAAIAGFSLQISTGESKPHIPDPANPFLALMHLNVQATASSAGTFPRTLVVTLTDTGFTTPIGGPIMISDSSGLNNSGTITFEAFYSTSNTEFDMTGSDTTSSGVLNAEAAQSSTVTPNPQAVPYSLTMVVTFTWNSAGPASSDTEVRIISPEPATIALVAGAFPLLGGMFWLRRRKKA